MAVPAPVLTVAPTTVTRTYDNPTPNVTLTDTATHTPAASSREFRADATPVKTVATAATTYPVDLAAGSRQMSVRTTNADGNAVSANVALTVTDNLATGLPAGIGVNNAVAYKTVTDPGKNTRLDPNTLPNEWKDPTIATPGLPTAQALVKARRTGSV